MFDKKVKKLISSKTTNTSMGAFASVDNQFLFGGAKKAATTRSGNGSVKFSSTGNTFVDQFGMLGKYREPRNYADIAKDCDTLWAENPSNCVKFIVYMRMISRKTNIVGVGTTTETAQSGAELKHEGIMRMIWLSQHSPDAFWNNIHLFLSAGSLKDIIVMLRTDLMFHGWEGRVLNWDRMGRMILSLLENPNTTNLMKKYLPQIKTNNKCKTLESQANNVIAKWLCSLLFGKKTNTVGGYIQYRKLKTSGTAHEWQKLISQKQFTRIEFDKIHGRALNLLVRSKFLNNQGLSDKYSAWISDDNTKEVKYTGFVHELLCELDFNTEKNFEKTVEKQFNELVNKVKGEDENLTSFIVVRDTSGSMTSPARGTKFSSNAIAKSLALYFSEFLSGTFANHWIEFSNTATLRKWRGSDVASKWKSDGHCSYGGTNFQSVIDLFCQLKRQGVPESDFPTGILCVSDGEFNPSQLGKTNVQTAMSKLKAAGFSKDYTDVFKIVLWNIPNGFYGRDSGCKFETFGDVKNVYYLSGYSASNVKFILESKVETAADLFNAAMDQELLNLVSV